MAIGMHRVMPFQKQVDLRDTLTALRARKSVPNKPRPPRVSDKCVSEVKHEERKCQDRVCTYWIAGRCAFGEKCRFLHSWVLGDRFTRMTQLRGHKKAVSGIAFPSSSDKLFTGSSDGTLRLWDCNTGKCEKDNIFNMGSEVGCIVNGGPWVFVGVLNAIWAWNIQTSVTLKLDGPVGKVHAMAVDGDTLFAACQNGDILAYKPCLETNTFKVAAKMTGHSKAAVSLTVVAERVYSGSSDNTIRIWEVDSFKCIHTLQGHSDTVTSLICWKDYLLSGSLDGTIKVWACNKHNHIEEIYTFKENEQHGVLALNGIIGSDGNPILLASFKDRSVHIYSLPTFQNCGKLFTRQEVICIHVAEEKGLLFTGDGSGNLDVWKLLEQGSS